ncbi:hypothetical protein BKA69DRAFT_1143797 [Paraphysoderma sedebokerense]|nr:hypothetical protein BKA69DRAFT_1143797 [Paraphysoderma sedebokerense]
MAINRLASGRTLSALYRSGGFAVNRAHSMTPSVVRTLATSSDGKQPDPRKEALNVINSVPKNKLVSQTGTILLGTSLAAIALSKELYVFNAETIVAASFIGIATVIFRGLKQPYVEWADGHINRIMGVMQKARDDHKVAVKERIDSVGQMANIVDVTQALFDMSRDMAQLEAKAYELKQKTAYVGDIKSTLDAWVRYEASVREREQKQLAQQVMEKLMAELKDPKVQQNILTQCLADVESS